MGLLVAGCPATLDDKFEYDESESTIEGTAAGPGAAGAAGAGTQTGGAAGAGGTGGALLLNGGTGGGTAGGDSGDGTGGSGAAGSGAAGGISATCSDGVRNQDETDVDCGGTTCGGCTGGLACVAGGDCLSGSCVAAAIDLVNTTSFQSGSPTVSESITLSSEPNRMLVVAIGIEASGGGGAVSSVTVDGTEMDLVVNRAVETNYRNVVYLYTLGEADLPAAGTYALDISINWYSEAQFHVLELSGVADQAPEATGHNGDPGPDVWSVSTSVTTLTDGGWVVDVVGAAEGVSFDPTEPGQQERSEESGNSAATAVSTQLVTAAGPATMGWDSSSASPRLVHAVAAFAPAGGGGRICQ